MKKNLNTIDNGICVDAGMDGGSSNYFQNVKCVFFGNIIYDSLYFTDNRRLFFTYCYT